MYLKEKKKKFCPYFFDWSTFGKLVHWKDRVICKVHKNKTGMPPELFVQLMIGVEKILYNAIGHYLTKPGYAL